MNPTYTYFIEKSSAAIRKLIIGEGNAKQRLRSCELEFALVLPLKVPKDLESVRDRIIKKIYKKEAPNIDGEKMMTDFEYNLMNMKNSTASKIIADFYTLYCNINLL